MLYKVITILLLVSPAVSARYEQYAGIEQNGTNCELVAKHYAEKYHMDMYMILSLKSNGAIQTGLYSGHWINSKVINSNRYFFEFGGMSCHGCGTEVILDSENAVRNWYKNRYAQDCVIYKQNEIPFQVVYHFD